MISTIMKATTKDNHKPQPPPPFESPQKPSLNRVKDTTNQIEISWMGAVAKSLLQRERFEKVFTIIFWEVSITFLIFRVHFGVNKLHKSLDFILKSKLAILGALEMFLNALLWIQNFHKNNQDFELQST